MGIAKTELAEADLTCRPAHAHLTFIGFLGLIDQRKDTLGRSQSALQGVIDIGQTLYRREQQDHGGKEGDEVPRR
jgi:hypothetical protein